MGKGSMGVAHLHRGGARGRGWGVTGAGRGDVCTPGGGSGSLMEWPGVRTPKMVRETQSRGPGRRRLGIWPFWGHWAGRQGGPDPGPLGRGVETPRPSQRQAEGASAEPRSRGPGAPRAGGRALHRGCAARGRTPASGGSGGGGSLAPWSPWMRMRGTRGLCRAGGGALGPRYRYSAAPGSRLETRLCG